MESPAEIDGDRVKGLCRRVCVCVCLAERERNRESMQGGGGGGAAFYGLWPNHLEGICSLFHL